ncbi:MAG: hypothetical protein GY772_21595, partial [bacterium]|nr:hypothetical protein [bacterium]
MSTAEFREYKEALQGLRSLPDAQAIYTRWPCGTAGYPRDHPTRSWRALMVWAWHEQHVAIKLTGKKSKKRPERSARLSVRGPRALDVYTVLFYETRAILGAQAMRKAVPAPPVMEA